MVQAFGKRAMAVSRAAAPIDPLFTTATTVGGSQTLDHLLKPGKGASSQELKAEIGGNTGPAAGSEPSQLPTPTDVNRDRRYEATVKNGATA